MNYPEFLKIIGIRVNFPEKKEVLIIYSEDIGTRTYEYEGEDMADDFNDFVKNNKLITPGKNIVNNQKYVFALNTKKKCRLDVQKAAELTGTVYYL